MTERWPADPAHISQTVARLREGAVIAFPTDTLYAIAARAGDPEAVARLYAIKRRPPAQPLIWLVSDPAEVEPFAIVSPEGARLMRRYWPGPLTLVLPARKGTRSSPPGLAVRAPNHPVGLELLRELGEPLASSSANRAGEPPPIDADAVLGGLHGELDIVLDGGRCQIGTASTIIDLTGREPRILREGAIPAQELMPS